MGTGNGATSAYKAIIFDLDGTLLDTAADIANAINHALDANGLATIPLDTLRKSLGSKDVKIVDSVLPKGTGADVAERAFKAFSVEYATHSDVETKPFPGILDTLRALRLSGFSLGVATDKNHVLADQLVAFHFGALVDGVCGRGEGIHGKPAPDTLIGVLEKLGLAANECLYVGDTTVDYEAAQAAGIDAVLVDWGYGPREALEATGAPIVDSTKELLQFITGTTTPVLPEHHGTAAVILAAGLSTRMGSSKPLLPFGDETVIETTVKKVAPLVDKVVVVTGYRADEVEDRLKDTEALCVRNLVYDNGEMFDSVKVGLGALKDMGSIQRIFVTPCDAPLIPREVFQLLMTSRTVPVAPSFGGGQGHPLLMPASAIEQVLAYSGEGGLEGCLRSCGMAPARMPVNDEAILMNMNTPEEYERVCRIYAECPQQNGLI